MNNFVKEPIPSGSKKAGIQRNKANHLWYSRYTPTGLGRCIGSVTPHAVILGTPVITAFGCDNCGVGNPEERSQPPWAYTPQRGWRGTRRTSGITFVISTSNNGTVPFVPLDSRASSRMTARGAVSRLTARR